MCDVRAAHGVRVACGVHGACNVGVNSTLYHGSCVSTLTTGHNEHSRRDARLSRLLYFMF